MTADDTKAGAGGANNANPVDEKEIEAALKTIRFVDEEGNEEPPKVAPPVAPTKITVTPHKGDVPAPKPAAPVPVQRVQAERAKKEAGALVPSAIVIPQKSNSMNGFAPEVKSATPPPPKSLSIPPLPPTPPVPVKAESELVKEDFAKILAETKLPERRGPGATAPPMKPEPMLVRTAPQKTETASQSTVRIITPEGSSAPMLSVPAKAGAATILEKSIVGEPSSAPAPHSPATSAVTKVSFTAEAPPDPVSQRLIVPSLRTLKDDLRDLVKIRKMSLIHAAALESDRAKKSGEVGAVAASTRMHRRMRLARFFLAVSVFVVLAGAALFAIFVVQSQRSGSSIRGPDFGQGLIFAEQTKTYPLSPDLSAVDMRAQLATARGGGGLAVGAMLRIAPTMTLPTGDRLATAPEFMHALAPNAPDALIRSLEGEVFFGFHSEDMNIPLIIMPITSYENAFAGMLAWEKTMNDDLSPLFAITQHTEVNAGGAPVLAQFEDVLLKNFDARALRDAQGNIKLLYSFPSRNYLIITESPYAFFEALARLQAQRRL